VRYHPATVTVRVLQLNNETDTVLLNNVRQVGEFIFFAEFLVIIRISTVNLEK
jgi:hypothetical protein